MHLSRSRFSQVAGMLVVIGMNLLLFSCQTTLPTASSQRQQQLQVVQPLTDEFVPFSETGILGRVTHNDSAMMVQLKIQDPPVVMRLLMMGITIWVDSTASQKQTLGVVFPGAGPILRQRPAGSDRFPAREQAADSVAPYQPGPLLDLVKQRNMVYRHGRRAEFITDDRARIFLDDQNNLNYVIRVPFEQLGIEDPGQARVSVGLVSETPVFQVVSPQESSNDPGRRGRPVYPYPQYGRPRQSQSMEPINQWIVFEFNGQSPESR